MACAELVERALHEMSENCRDLARNSLCYGFDRISASFAQDFAGADFNSAGDRAPLGPLDRLQTFSLDLVNRQWGVAVMNLQAHLPHTRAGPGVIMMLAGAAELLSESDPISIQEVGEPISTAATVSATRFAQPAIIAEEVGHLEPESIVLVDAISSARDWLRVVSDGSVSWVQSDRMARLQAMDSLPIIDIGAAFALQSFAFTSSTDLPECADAEPMLVLQTPDETPVNLSINGADIHIASLVSLQQVHSNALALTVHRGSLTTTSGATVKAGNTVIGIVGATAERDHSILAWSGALPASEAELARGERAQIALNKLARNNGWDEYDSEMEAGQVIHTVVYGDTLFAIARLYQVRVDDIIAANNRRDPSRLLVGDELVIPNPGSGFGGRGTVAVSVVKEPMASAPDCSGLRLTSPLKVATGVASPYYWDGIAAAQRYQVNVYDSATGTLVGSPLTSGKETSIHISAGQLGVGGALQWEVIALADGQPICSSGKSEALQHVSS